MAKRRWANDLAFKIEIAMAAADKGENKQFAAWVLIGSHPSEEAIQKLAESIGNWRRGTRTDNDGFFSLLATRLEISPDEPTEHLMKCSAKEFFDCLPTDYQNNVLRLLSDNALQSMGILITGVADNSQATALAVVSSRPPIFSEPPSDVDHVIYKSHVHEFRDKEKFWKREGHVDQKYMYLNLDSVEHWQDVIFDPGYRNYRYCLAALETFLSSEGWVHHAVGIQTVVILGAGTPDKESTIVYNLIGAIGEGRYSSSQRLRVVLVDASPYMLDDTYIRLRALFKKWHFDSLVEIIPCWADFNHLKPHEVRIRPEGHKGKVAFFILGGTIGNIDEGQFLRSVHEVSRPGDLLVVSAEFHSAADDPIAYRQNLLSTYSGDGPKDLVLGPIRRMLDQQHVPESRVERRKLVIPRLREGDVFLSPIAGTIGVELQVQTSEGHLALSISKRYDHKAFPQFFGTAGFLLVDQWHCIEFKPYRQLMFVRTDRLPAIASPV